MRFNFACKVLFGGFFSTKLLPDRVFLRDNIKEILLPTLTGQMGVLKGHIPLLTGLDIGRYFNIKNIIL